MIIACIISFVIGAMLMMFALEIVSVCKDKEPLIHWISVKEDLPCNHEELMTVDNKGRPETKRVLVRIQETDTSFQRPYYADCMMSKWDVKEDKFLWHLCSQGYITHWMPIPELPKE